MFIVSHRSFTLLSPPSGLHRPQPSPNPGDRPVSPAGQGSNSQAWQMAGVGHTSITLRMFIVSHRSFTLLSPLMGYTGPPGQVRTGPGAAALPPRLTREEPRDHCEEACSSDPGPVRRVITKHEPSQGSCRRWGANVRDKGDLHTKIPKRASAQHRDAPGWKASY